MGCQNVIFSLDLGLHCRNALTEQVLFAQLQYFGSCATLWEKSAVATILPDFYRRTKRLPEEIRVLV